MFSLPINKALDVLINWLNNNKDDVPFSVSRKFFVPQWIPQLVLLQFFASRRLVEYLLLESGCSCAWDLFNKPNIFTVSVSCVVDVFDHWISNYCFYSFVEYFSQLCVLKVYCQNLKNSILTIPKVLQTLNLNNQRTASAMSFDMGIVRKDIEYSFKSVRWKYSLFLLF